MTRPDFVLLLLLVPLGAGAQPAPDSGAVVVNEIMYAPSPASNEFIELYNRSDAPINLSRLEFADANRTFSLVTDADTLLRPDTYVVLARDRAAFTAAFPSVDPLIPADWPALNNGGDTVFLRDAPSKTALDAVPYAPSWGGDDGRSLERVDPAGPSDAAFNFAPSTAESGATPGRRNSRYDPDETAPVPVFAEQVADERVAVTFSEPILASSVTADAFDLESASVTQARLVRDSVALLSLTAAPSGTTLRVEGIRDRVDNVLAATPHPLARRPDDGDVAISEILFDPRADDFDDRPNQVEYVELLNRTDRPLTLNGLFMTDRPTESGVADTIRPGRRVALSPHGYGVVAAAPEDAQAASASQLARAFPDAPLAADSTAFLPVDGSRLGLKNSGDLVRLHRRDGTVVAAVSYSPDWHAPGLADTKGTALARISPTGRPNAPDNWTSSPDSAGGTPGTRNAVSLAPDDGSSDADLHIAPSPFSVERDGATRIRYTLDGVPNLVRARIFDARGRTVRTLEDARLTGHTGELVWNGQNDAGQRVRVGVYVVLLEAVRAGEGVVSRLKAPVVVARPLN